MCIVIVMFSARYFSKQIYFAFVFSLYHFKNTEKTLRCTRSLDSFISDIFESTHQGPVVLSIVSLTSLLMTNLLTAVAKVFSNTLIFFCKNVSKS